MNEYGYYRDYMEIPFFQGQQKIEELLDWFYDVERNTRMQEGEDSRHTFQICSCGMVGVDAGNSSLSSETASTFLEEVEEAHEEEVPPQEFLESSFHIVIEF